MEDAALYKVLERGAYRPDGKRLAIGITATANEIADLDAMIAAKIVIGAPKPDLAPGRKTAYTVYEVEKIREEYEARIEKLQAETKAHQAGALYAFMGWLTSREAESGPFSGSLKTASDAANLTGDFCKAQGWPDPVIPEWTNPDTKAGQTEDPTGIAEEISAAGEIDTPAEKAETKKKGNGKA